MTKPPPFGEGFVSSLSRPDGRLLGMRVGWRRSAVLYSMGVFSTISQTPHGQAPAQKPQPMHLSGSEKYS